AGRRRPGGRAVPVRRGPQPRGRAAAQRPAGGERPGAGPRRRTRSRAGMILLGLVPILCSGLLGLAAGPLRRRLSPSVAAPLLALAALATSLATGVVLCLAGFLALARYRLVADLGGWSGAGLRPWRLLPATWATLAGVAAAVLLVSALGCLAQVTCDLIRASRACRRLDGAAHRLRISPDEHPAAFTVPVRRTIVMSAGPPGRAPARRSEG